MGKLASKTSSIHLPANRQEIPELIDALKAIREEEAKLTAKIERLRADCEQFELPPPTVTLKQMEWSQWEVL